MQKRRGLIAAIAAITFSLIVVAPAQPLANPQPQFPAVTKTEKQVKAALTMLKNIETLKALNYSDYDREGQFGDSWLDVDGNRCDTRNDILERDLKNEAYNDSCEIRTGVLKDPYTGKVINFVRGVGTSIKVQIDHVIPLAFAWRSGANTWSLGKRVAFANDPINLIAVDGPTNGSKSDSGPDEWMPPRDSYHCTYVIRFTRVAHQYGLGLTSRVKSAIKSELKSCTKVIGSPANLTPLSPSTWSRAAALAS
jgi:hypothetical protein